MIYSIYSKSFKVLLTICSLVILISCGKTEETTSVTPNDNFDINTTYNTTLSKLTLSITSEEIINGIQFEIIDEDNTALTIQDFELNPSYNLYQNTCFTYTLSNNIGVCFVPTSNINNPISVEGTITINMQIEETLSATVKNIVIVNTANDVFEIESIE